MAALLGKIYTDKSVSAKVGEKVDEKVYMLAFYLEEHLVVL
jgi:hypothetical protein